MRGGAGGLRLQPIRSAGAWQQALAVALGVATGPIAAQAVAAGKQGAAIGQAVDAVRVQALGQWLKKRGGFLKRELVSLVVIGFRGFSSLRLNDCLR